MISFLIEVDDGRVDSARVGELAGYLLTLQEREIVKDFQVLDRDVGRGLWIAIRLERKKTKVRRKKHG